MKLADLGYTLADLDLGGFDAESDVRLADYFVETPYVAAALAGRRTLFLGRKGSGKSALFAQLPRLVDRAVVVQLTPDQYAWSALKQYKELGLLPEAAHTSAWRLTLAIEVASALVALDKVDWSDDATKSKQVLADFIEQNFGKTSPGLAKTASSLLKGLSSFNLSAFGFGVGLSQSDKQEHELTPAVISALQEALKDLLAEQPVVVALDRLDDSWDGSAEAHSLLIGLLKAAKQLNDELRTAASSEDMLRVLVFLRSDIYGGLKFDDKG